MQPNDLPDLIGGTRKNMHTDADRIVQEAVKRGDLTAEYLWRIHRIRPQEVPLLEVRYPPVLEGNHAEQQRLMDEISINLVHRLDKEAERQGLPKYRGPVPRFWCSEKRGIHVWRTDYRDP